MKDLGISNELFDLLLDKSAYKEEFVASEGVKTSFYQVEDVKIELLRGEGDDNVITKYVDKKGEGIHHIAFIVDDIVFEMKRLENLGFELLSDLPKQGADNKLICFLHPKCTNGVLIELCQEIDPNLKTHE